MSVGRGVARRGAYSRGHGRGSGARLLAGAGIALELAAALLGAHVVEFVLDAAARRAKLVRLIRNLSCICGLTQV